MEGVVKDVMPLISNKRELFLGLHISFPWRYRGKKNAIYYYQSLGIVLYLQKNNKLIIKKIPQ